MKFALPLSSLLLSFILVSCSTTESDCKNKDWFQEGRNALSSHSDLSQTLTNHNVYCGKYFPSNAQENFLKGAEHEKFIQCTGYPNWHTDNWNGLGKDAALRGEKEDFYKDLKNKCQLSPNSTELTAYKNSYKQGLALLCTKTGGVDFSRKGLVYKSTCPKKNEDEFFAGNALGLKLRDIDSIRKKADDLNEKIVGLEKENNQLQTKIDACQEKAREMDAGKKDFGLFEDCNISTKDSITTDIRLKRNTIMKNLRQILEWQKQKENFTKEADRLLKEMEIIHLSR